jgi:hypothetical protein
MQGEKCIGVNFFSPLFPKESQVLSSQAVPEEVAVKQ